MWEKNVGRRCTNREPDIFCDLVATFCDFYLFITECSLCAGKSRPWGIQTWVQRPNPTTWDWSVKFEFSTTSKLTRSVSNARISKFDSPFDGSESVLSSALWFGAVRHFGELVAPYFWNPSKIVELGAKCVHKVPKSVPSTESPDPGAFNDGSNV